MKRSIHILLIALFLLPLLSLAREETMEERKKRLARKYLRERVNLVQSESMVIMDDPVAENVLDSERFKDARSDAHEHESETEAPPPRRPPSKPTNRNWLLAEDPVMTDPYAPENQKKKTHW